MVSKFNFKIFFDRHYNISLDLTNHENFFKNSSFQKFEKILKTFYFNKKIDLCISKNMYLLTYTLFNMKIFQKNNFCFTKIFQIKQA